ncbi:putative ribosomal RNA large subunit methyltransferase N [Tieghemostelium lacteum]|uniref:Putative ribosomal RNA large subunit methyltransferase N n=1 Tax=Tieghemostelium lacteum TaxID=361077 RepID=A0A151ZAT5_TIELA|nr:putative ribosomal RNA large subunit methyltransferase N [Tieghemostelium lacteum]|eukprot:KYQ91057.1 putative ribosomal RNA large subunit methyltransferase N [Tieghemostelium lacteum]
MFRQVNKLATLNRLPTCSQNLYFYRNYSTGCGKVSGIFNFEEKSVSPSSTLPDLNINNININNSNSLNNTINDNKKNILSLSKDDLIKECQELHMTPFNANQIWNWVYNKNKMSIDSFSNISLEKRNALKEKFYIDFGTISKDSLSVDGTRKFLLEFKGGDKVECVFIPEANRGTLCVSSQVGCTFSCSFCHTGTQKLVRNLTSDEIVAQVLATRMILGDTQPNKKRLLTHIVFMGQGEPLYNYRNVSKAIQKLTDGNGISLGKSKITLSTSGVVPLIDKLSKDHPGVGLAISLHASNDKTRDELVPCNKQWNIEELMNSCIQYSKTNRDRITIEYVMLKDVNDSIEDAYKLAQLIKPFPSFVNLIPFNQWPGTKYVCSSNNAIHRFSDVLQKQGIKVTIRQPRGRDILAACGTLKSDSVKKPKTVPPPL